MPFGSRRAAFRPLSSLPPSETLTFLFNTTLRSVILILGVVAILGTPATAQCTPVGADITCGALISVIQTFNYPCPQPQGCAPVSFTGQGPYDTIDDTMVGVINNTTLPITSLDLNSNYGLWIFAFDGDGICGVSPITGLPFVPAPPACPYGPTGYEGPGVSFTNLIGYTTGTVNFNPPIPADGGSAYFSLEQSLSDATACTDIIDNSVVALPGDGVNQNFTFTPNYGFTLAQAAQLCGFIGFDWVQTVTHLPDPSPYCENNTSLGVPNPSPFCEPFSSSPPFPIHLTSAFTPFNDQPPGGFTYPYSFNSFPFYYPSAIIASDELLGTPTLCIEKTPAGRCVLLDIDQTGTILNFFDAPGDPCFAGGKGVGMPECGFGGVPLLQSYQAYSTHVAGINSDGTPTDLGIGFDWFSTFNGGIDQGTTIKRDPGEGTGGITITNVNEITGYQYPKNLAVIAINGNPVNPPSAGSALFTGTQISATASGLAYSRLTKTFNGTLTIKNISNSPVNGPFQIVFNSLTVGVTLANATGSFGGFSYLLVPSVGSLAPGQPATVNVQFSNPLNKTINFMPLTYSGSFN